MGDISGAGDLFTIDLASGALARATFDTETYNAHPDWSPLADVIAFYSTRPPEGIWTITVGAASGRFLTPGFVAAWDPSGEVVAVVNVYSLSNGVADEAVLSIVDADTGISGEETAIQRAVNIAPAQLAWSPDGEGIAVLLSQSESIAGPIEDVLYRFSRPTREAQEVARARIDSAQWLNADTILYTVTGPPLQEGTVELRALHSAGNCRAVYLEEGPMHSIRLSPAGDKLAYIGVDGVVYLLDLGAVLGPDIWAGSDICR